MTPHQYEEHVAAHFKKQGFETRLTPRTNDFGVDVFATKGDEQIAIQAKMYGGSSRPINHEMVLQLQGAKDYFNCNQAMIVTNGRMTTSATEVAEKLGIPVLLLSADEAIYSPSVGVLSPSPSAFDRIWIQYILPLAGKIISSPAGRTNKIMVTLHPSATRQFNVRRVLGGAIGLHRVHHVPWPARRNNLILTRCSRRCSAVN